MELMGFTRHARRLAAALRLAGMLAALVVVVVPRSALAQDRAVGREALDPADPGLPPAIDGRTDSPEEVDPRALDDFREPLAPYGAWVNDSEYGTVWVPDAREVGRDFYPYSTGGRWELTSEGDWLWVSDYSWGDIPFHYGRWVYIGGRGWAWIPGRVWAPAWVVWRTGPHGYLGWAPCPPTWTWWYGSATWLWWPPPAAYLFVDTRYVFDRHVHRHVIRTPARAQHAAAQTRPQRQPARPGAPSYDRFRPASPDLQSIRYAGPTPPRNPMRTHPEVGLVGDRAVGRADGAGSRNLGPRTRGGERPLGLGERDGSRSGRRPGGASSGPSLDPGLDPGRHPGRGPRGGGGVRPDAGPRDVAPRDSGPRDLAPRDAGPPVDDAPRGDSRPTPDPASRRDPGNDAPRPSAPSGGGAPSGGSGVRGGSSMRPAAPSVAPARPSIRPSAPSGGPRGGGPRGGGRGR